MIGKPLLEAAVTAVAVIVAPVLGAAPLHAQEPPPLAVQSERLVSGDEFGDPWGLEVGPDGRLYVGFPDDGLVRVVDPETGAVETLSVAEHGPRLFPSVVRWTGDTLWAMDRERTTAVLFDDAWEPIRSVSLLTPGRMGEIRAFGATHLLPGERLLVRTWASIPAMAMADPDFDGLPDDFPPHLGAAEAVTEIPVWTTDHSGAVLDTLVSLSTRNRAAVLLRPEGAPRGRSVMRQVPQPFADYPLLGVDPTASHFVMVDRPVEGGPGSRESPRFTVHRLTLDGDTMSTLHHTYEPVPLREAWIEAAAREYGEGISADTAAAIAAARDVLYTPAWLPPVSRVLVGREGWAWLRRERIPDSERLRWEIHDPDGERVGAIEVRSTIEIRAVHGLEAWAIEGAGDDAFDLWHLSVRRP
ncbi:MAG: hypothetical protein ACOC8B_04120 [Gemmatimonadota bacterium]